MCGVQRDPLMRDMCGTLKSRSLSGKRMRLTSLSNNERENNTFLQTGALDVGSKVGAVSRSSASVSFALKIRAGTCTRHTRARKFSFFLV